MLLLDASLRPVSGFDETLNELIPEFERWGVYSRGRFGMWKYEVSNQDHSFMQGVEVIERILNGRSEMTAFNAEFGHSKSGGSIKGGTEISNFTSVI